VFKRAEPPLETTALRRADVDLERDRHDAGILRSTTGHFVGMVLSTYARWLDGDHDTMEMGRVEASLRRDSSPDLTQERCRWRAVQR
jgi:hypothetical protein